MAESALRAALDVRAAIPPTTQRIVEFPVPTPPQAPEDWLRAQIVACWGYSSDHVRIFDQMRGPHDAIATRTPCGSESPSTAR